MDTPAQQPDRDPGDDATAAPPTPVPDAAERPTRPDAAHPAAAPTDDEYEPL